MIETLTRWPGARIADTTGSHRVGRPYRWRSSASDDLTISTNSAISTDIVTEDITSAYATVSGANIGSAVPAISAPASIDPARTSITDAAREAARYEVAQEVGDVVSPIPTSCRDETPAARSIRLAEFGGHIASFVLSTSRESGTALARRSSLDEAVDA